MPEISLSSLSTNGADSCPSSVWPDSILKWLIISDFLSNCPWPLLVFLAFSLVFCSIFSPPGCARPGYIYCLSPFDIHIKSYYEFFQARELATASLDLCLPKAKISNNSTVSCQLIKIKQHSRTATIFQSNCQPLSFPGSYVMIATLPEGGDGGTGLPIVTLLHKHVTTVSLAFIGSVRDGCSLRVFCVYKELCAISTPRSRLDKLRQVLSAKEPLIHTISQTHNNKNSNK